MTFLADFHGIVAYVPADREMDGYLKCACRYLDDATKWMGYEVCELETKNSDPLLGNKFFIGVPYEEKYMTRPHESVPVLAYKSLEDLMESKGTNAKVAELGGVNRTD